MEENFNIEEPLFPFFPEEIKAFNNTIAPEVNTTEEIYKEIAWDYEKNKPLILNGNFATAEGLEAVKTWCWKTLNTERYKHLIYTWNYAVDMDQFVGQSFNNLTKVEIIREITEGLLQNEYVTSVGNFNIVTDRKKVFIEFTIGTAFGTIDERREVLI